MGNYITSVDLLKIYLWAERDIQTRRKIFIGYALFHIREARFIDNLRQDL